MSEAALFWGAVILTPSSHAVGSLPAPTPFFPLFVSASEKLPKAWLSPRNPLLVANSSH